MRPDTGCQVCRPFPLQSNAIGWIIEHPEVFRGQDVRAELQRAYEYRRILV